MSAQPEPANDLDNSYLFHQLDSYPWDEDQEFQGGLRAILGSVQDPSQVEHLTLRAKCYYYARKAGTPVDFNGYKQWVDSSRNGDASLDQAVNLDTQGNSSIEHSDAGAGGGGMADAPKPASFAEICDMIAEGKPIPGIKDIPDTILEGQASHSQVNARRKPWEKAPAVVGGGEGVAKPSWMK